tara:strand:+ start:344 stop:550 length:207 start_codon:yes stop_codon:yes gene_type:complete
MFTKQAFRLAAISLAFSVLSVAQPRSASLASAQTSACTKPAVVVATEEVMPVTKANYADAETQTIFAK